MSREKAKSDKPAAGGPKTESGRYKSALNAIRHGVLSNKMIVLQSESDDELDELKLSYYTSLQPVGDIEFELVDEMIWAKWRQRRAIASETATIDYQMDKDHKKVDQICSVMDDCTRTALAIKTLANESNDLALLNRYETRFNRMYHRALRQLLEMQDRRRRNGEAVENKQPVPAPEPENMKLPNEPESRIESMNISRRTPFRAEPRHVGAGFSLPAVLASPAQFRVSASPLRLEIRDSHTSAKRSPQS